MDSNGKARMTSSSPSALISATYELAQSGEPLSLVKQQSCIRTALQDLGSGLLTAEFPTEVEATIAALLPVICDPLFADRVDWQVVLADEDDSEKGSFAEGAVNVFASRCAAHLSDQLDLRTADRDDDDDLGMYIGVLGDATRCLRAVSVILEESSKIGVQFLLEDRVLSDLIFSCFRVKASGDLSGFEGRQRNGNVSMEAAVRAVRGEAKAVSSSLLARLPAFGRRTRTVSALIVRVWRTDAARDGIHRHLAIGLKREDAMLHSSEALARLSLAAIPKVVRALVDALDDDHVEDVLAQILSVTLPVAGDTSPVRRCDALAVVSRSLLVCDQAALSQHAPVVVTALTESLRFGDWTTALDTFSSLAVAMRLVYPVVVIQKEPPAVWKEALKEALRVFVSFLEECQDSETDVEESKSILLTVAAIGRYIPETAGMRLVLKLELVLTAMGEALVLSAHAVRRDGEDALPVLISVKKAFVDVLRHTWPRVPSHFGVIIGAAFRAVMHARVAGDSSVLAAVTKEVADLLFHAASCGEVSRFISIMDGVRGTLEQYESLSAGLALHRAATQRIAKLNQSQNLEQPERSSVVDTVSRSLDNVSLNM